MNEPVRIDDATPGTGDQDLDALLASMRAAPTIGPPPPEPCTGCGGVVALSDAQLYGQEDRPKRCQTCRVAHNLEDRSAKLRNQIPSRFAWASLASPELARRVKGLAVAGLSPERLARLYDARAVAFAGPAGSGKTSLAVALLRSLVAARPIFASFVRARHLANARAQHSLGSGEAPLVSRAASADVLLIDDLGAERKTELSALADVIQDRYDDELPTWVTTGFTEEQIGQMYGAGVQRRLFEGATVIRLGGAP